MSAASERANLVFDWLEASPSGLTVDDMQERGGWSLYVTKEAIRTLRLILGGVPDSDARGTPDSINVVCNPAGRGQQWVYRLVGNVADADWYVANRIGDMESRLATQVGIASSLEVATDGRTANGRKARKIRTTLTYLLGELADIGTEDMV